MSNPVQPLDPQGAPSPVTPSGGPSSPEGFAGVTPHGQGPAPYDIQAPSPQAELEAAYASAGAVNGAGIVYGQSPRQAATEALLSSAQGYGDFSITAGYAGGSGESWPANPDPGANAQTPDQGMGDFTGTGTD
jgi:hypothetical protein